MFTEKGKSLNKSVISLITIAFCISFITGCGSSKEQSVIKSTEVVTSSEELVTDEVGSTENTKNGSPWINSCLYGNVTKDMEVSPKDDIFLYVNRDWLSDTKMPEGERIYSLYSELYKDNVKRMVELLDKNQPDGHDAQIVQDLYDKFLDMDARNEAGVKPLEEICHLITDVSSIEELNELITESNYADTLYSLVEVYAEVGLETSDTYICWIEPKELLLYDSAEYDELSEYGQTRYDYKKDEFIYLAGRLGMDESKADKIFDNAIEYERKFAKYIYTQEEQMSSEYLAQINNPLTLDEVSSISVNYPLEEIIKSRGLAGDISYLNTTPEYLEHIDEFYNDECLEAIKDTMLVHYLGDKLPLLDEESYQKSIALKSIHYGIEGEMDSKENAYNSVTESLAIPASKVFVANFSSEEDRQVVEDTCYKVIDAYKEILLENDWLCGDTKKKAVEKLNAISVHVGWPDVWDDYSGLDISGLNLTDALAEIESFKTKIRDKKIGTKKDIKNWATDELSLVDTNAFYDWQDNSINMNVGMMGAPFYYSDMPVEELYASLGAFWIGHEISHGFDSNGSQFDKNGSFNNWWTEQDLAEFKKRVKKTDDYLDSILIMGDYYVNGSNVDSEMIADFTGLQCAVKMAKKVDNFDYKKFFEYYAKMNVSIDLYQSQLSSITTDSHPLDYLRANVPIQQFDEFIRAYDVKPGDKMYLALEDRILIW